MRFQPKRDVLYGIIIFGMSIALCIYGSYILLSDSGWVEKTLVSGLCFVLGIGGFWAWFGTYYIITEEHLIIKQGPFQTKIDLHEINKIEKSYMPIASVALSTKRYNMQYGRFDTATIAPKDIKAFVDQIEKNTNNKIKLID